MLNPSSFKRSRNRPEGHWETPRPARPAPSVPDHFCVRCPACQKTLFEAEVEAGLRVCPQCGHHMRLSARQRVEMLCDAGSFEEWDAGLSACDSLNFPDYPTKLRNGRLATGEKSAVLCGRAAIGGQRCAFFAMEPGFMMGSMSSAVGEKITRLFERATAERLPVVGVTASGGARMQEGILSLMQMAKTSGAVKRHSDAGLLYLALLSDPTSGGVTASFAMEADILLSEPGALIAFAGPRVIEQTIRQKLPKNFQRAEYLLEHGFLDAVIKRRKLKKVLGYLLRLHAEDGAAPAESADPAAGEPGEVQP
ncbi:acetyl-CoA carboxylase, carboxyltransferase subunit beta [Ruminococcaceae bacterium OttesenSCG-928-D13]|nr:acetyl-CoA carboxylase, carboxyltransferase subunit beta [Ruminococcaceae bacterium OttesenSCG-928-D13]